MMTKEAVVIWFEGWNVALSSYYYSVAREKKNKKEKSPAEMKRARAELQR